METPWQNITRRIDISPATIDRTKDKERQKGRVLGRIPYVIQLPAIDFIPFDVIDVNDPLSRGLIAMQFNGTAPLSFKLEQPQIKNYSLPIGDIVSLYIRYRVGETIYRYRLPYQDADMEFYAQQHEFVQCPTYTQQSIGKYFSIEVIFGEILNEFVPIQIPAQAFTISANKIPDTPDQHFEDIVLASYSRTSLTTVVNLNEPIPTPYPAAMSWLSN